MAISSNQDLEFNVTNVQDNQVLVYDASTGTFVNETNPLGDINVSAQGRNIGSNGVGVFKQMDGVYMEFHKLRAGANTTLSLANDIITIDARVGTSNLIGERITLNNPAQGTMISLTAPDYPGTGTVNGYIQISENDEYADLTDNVGDAANLRLRFGSDDDMDVELHGEGGVHITTGSNAAVSHIKMRSQRNIEFHTGNVLVDSEALQINTDKTLRIAGNYTLPNQNGAPGEVLTAAANGFVYWANPESPDGVVSTATFDSLSNNVYKLDQTNLPAGDEQQDLGSSSRKFFEIHSKHFRGRADLATNSLNLGGFPAADYLKKSEIGDVTGAKGDTGEKGDKGQKGEVGSAGVSGAKGEKGAAGAKGEQGATGATGEKGAPGAAGAKGEQGATGATGATGAKGEKGAAGAKGEQGGTGPAGVKGEKGEQGIPGTAAAKGDKGNTGSQGPAGAKGQKGEIGEGDKGQKGAAGETVTAADLSSGNLIFTLSDASTLDAGAVTLGNTGVTAGTYGNATHVASLTVESDGRLSNISLVEVQGSGPIVERPAQYELFRINYDTSGAVTSISEQSNGVSNVTIVNSTDINITFSNYDFPPSSFVAYGYDYSNNRYNIKSFADFNTRFVPGGGTSGSPTAFGDFDDLTISVSESETGASRTFGSTTHAYVLFTMIG